MPGISREAQANPVLQPSDMVLFLPYLKSRFEVILIGI